MATSLSPVNAAVSPQQVARILPIRVNLLPEEITAARTAKRMRTLVIAAVVAVVVALGGWYTVAARDLSAANDEQTAATERLDSARAALKNADLVKVTTVTGQTDTLSKQLRTVMTNDLSWSSMVTSLRSTTDPLLITLTGINIAVKDAKPVTTTADSAAAAAAAAAAGTPTAIGTLSLTGDAPDKNTVATLIEKLPGVTGVANPYVSSVTQTTDASGAAAGGVQFTITTDVTSAALCGRFSVKTCKVGN